MEALLFLYGVPWNEAHFGVWFQREDCGFSKYMLLPFHSTELSNDTSSAQMGKEVLEETTVKRWDIITEDVLTQFPYYIRQFCSEKCLPVF